MLKYTGVELDLLTDPDMYIFLEQGIRGGFSAITHRRANANNPYTEEYDTSKPSNYIMYLDANNLYGWAMSQKMPISGLKIIRKLLTAIQKVKLVIYYRSV
jgi:hypothetical protein